MTRPLATPFEHVAEDRSFLGRTADFTRRLLRVRLAGPSVVVLLAALAAALFAPWLAPHSPEVTDAYATLAGPSWTHLLGTDQLGRDVLSRLIYGARVDLGVGVGAIAFGTVIGVPLGLFSGYVRGFADEALMRFMDALVAFPGLILALGLVAVRGPSVANLILAIGIANVPWLARITRGQVLSVREQEYVTAARSLGAGHLRIVLSHVTPNTLAPIIVQSTLGMGYAVLAEAGLSFLGLGVPPPTPSWGSMLQFAFQFIQIDPWLSIVPGLAIFALVLSFNLLGDALRDTLDPRLRGSI